MGRRCSGQSSSSRLWRRSFHPDGITGATGEQSETGRQSNGDPHVTPSERRDGADFCVLRWHRHTYDRKLGALRPRSGVAFHMSADLTESRAVKRVLAQAHDCVDA